MAIEDCFLSDSTKVNHDLNFLYLIARTVLPKDVLETLMYGEGFEEPTEEDLIEIEMLIKSNNLRKMTNYTIEDWRKYFENQY